MGNDQDRCGMFAGWTCHKTNGPSKEKGQHPCKETEYRFRCRCGQQKTGWHATDKDGATGILSTGWRMSSAGIYGKGIYFAADKASAIAKAKAFHTTDGKKMEKVIKCTIGGVPWERAQNS